jgi:hypothetical protein
MVILLVSNRDLYALFRAFLWAEGEIRLTALNREYLLHLRVDRLEILSGISLWLGLEAEREYEEYLTRQLHRLWDRELRGDVSDSD